MLLFAELVLMLTLRGAFSTRDPMSVDANCAWLAGVT